MIFFEKKSTIITLNSVGYYLSSYLFIFFLFQFATVITSQFFDISNVLYFNKIDYIVPSTESWTFDSVKMVFSSGCIIALFAGLICLVIYIKAIRLEGTLKLFFFWAFVHGLNMFVGSSVLGAFFFEGMGYVYAWMYLQDTVKMFLLFAGLFVMLGTGTTLVKPMLLSANSYYNSSRAEMRTAFKKEQFFIPYLISTAILIVVRLPLSFYELLLLITPGLVLLPLFSGLHRFTIFFFDEEERKIKLNIRSLLIASSLLVVFRVVWGIGIHIGG